jgi:thiamine-monophosphate kinase
MSENRLEISQLGEFGLIDRIKAGFELKNGNSLVGIGDDAAVIDTAGEQPVFGRGNRFIIPGHQSSM